MTTLVKTPMEIRRYFYDLAAKMPTGATLTSVQAFASRLASLTAPLESTQLQASVAAGDTVIPLNANPGAGATLIIEPGGSIEDRVKVVSVAGSSAPFTATVDPAVWYPHTATVNVSYEPGLNARMLVDDTPSPSGSTVFLLVQRGCDLQDYVITVHGVTNGGERVEEEFKLEVRDVAALDTRVKQPSEMRDAAALMEALLSEPHQAGASLTGGITFASAMTSTPTTLAGAAATGDSTVSLPVHPGVGALLVIEPTGKVERCYVSAVSGTGPFVCTIHPSVEFSHSSGVGVTFFTGVSANFMTSATPTILGTDLVNRVRRGAAGKLFKLVWLADSDQGEKLQHAGIVSVVELVD